MRRLDGRILASGAAAALLTLAGAAGAASDRPSASCSPGGITVCGPGNIGDDPNPAGGPLIVRYRQAVCTTKGAGAKRAMRVRLDKGPLKLDLYLDRYHGAGFYDLKYGEHHTQASFTHARKGFYASWYDEPANRESLSGWIQVNKNPLRVFIRSVLFRSFNSDKFVYAFGAVRCA
jgi:hypothetical protein